MTRLAPLLATILAAAAFPAAAQDPLVPIGSTWRYLDDGSDQGIAWRAATFDDSSWASGPAQLGYGDGDEATVVDYGPDPDNRYLTTYFRHGFDVPDPGAFTGLTLHLLYDDGAVAYLNGVEVARLNMPGVPGSDDIDYTTLASTGIEQLWGEVEIDPARLVAGPNLLAVEIHQSSPSSSDISLELQLAPTQPALRKGPYLIYPGVNTEMEVHWQLADTETCRLEWGRDASYGDGRVDTSEYGADHQHAHRITGLTPGVDYFYRVLDGSGTGFPGQFRAAPPEAAARVALLGYGDTRTGTLDYDDVCAGMVERVRLRPDLQTLVLHTGDWSTDDGEPAWQGEFFASLAGSARELLSRVPVAGCRGNHDGDGIGLAKYWPWPMATDFHFSFDYGPVHVAVVDQYAPYDFASDQYRWLDDDLATSRKPWKILVFHEPPWTAGGHGNDADAQTYLHPLAVAHGVALTLAGHNHYYARAEVDGVLHITCGGGGAPLYDCDPTAPFVVTCARVYQHAEIDIRCNQLQLRALDTAGNEIDSVTVTNDAPDLHRFTAKTELAAVTPEAAFATGGLPWTDPDDVLQPSAPPRLYYVAPCATGRIAVVKDGLSVRLLEM